MAEARRRRGSAQSDEERENKRGGVQQGMKILCRCHRQMGRRGLAGKVQRQGPESLGMVDVVDPLQTNAKLPPQPQAWCVASNVTCCVEIFTLTY